MIVLLMCVAVLSLLLALHPFVTYPLSLVVLRAWRGRQSPILQSRGVESRVPARAQPLSFSVCMCAYNEERVIERKIENLLQLRQREPGLQILVYVDAATDRTTEILQRYASEIELHVAPQRHGKTYGMNLLSGLARGDVLVFTDANVMLDLACLDDLRRHFADPGIGCVCGNLNYTNAGASVTAQSGSLYWRFEEALKRLESQTGSMMGADGSIFALRRKLRRAPPDHIIDDMYVSLMVLVEGYRVIQASDVRAFEESVSNSKEEFSRKVRIACQAFNVHRLLWPQLRRSGALNRYKYVSHKLTRWLSIYFLALSAIAALAALLLAGYVATAAVLVALAVLCAVLGYAASVRPFVQVVDVLLALTGAGLGVWRSLRGERYQTWSPAASIRGG